MTADERLATAKTNANSHPPQRAREAEDLLTAVQKLVTLFISAADDGSLSKLHALHLHKVTSSSRSVLLEQHPPKELLQLVGFSLPEDGRGKDGFIEMVQKILQYSVNIWDQGFLDKLYAATTPVGLAADLVLSSLNSNVHVYQVSPVLTVIEKQTGEALASMFGLDGPYAGGITQPGGSAANQSSMVIARNNLYPETKTEGNGMRKFVLFTSAHGHYSVEKAAQMFGFGSNAVRSIEVDNSGRMLPAALDAAIGTAKEAGETPFYVNATAGTTVLGSFDPLDEIAEVCNTHGLWLHVDGSWGGSVVFSDQQRYKLKGVEKADSIATCPHKMLNVPLTCSYLLGKDLRQFHKAMTLPAGYLFHSKNKDVQNDISNDDSYEALPSNDGSQEYWDLADLTPQCGRRGDSLKLALSWIYYGSSGFAAYIDNAFEVAAHFASLIQAHPQFTLVSQNPPPCLQVSFYYDKRSDLEANSQTTVAITKKLISYGFMTDFAPGKHGKFFRVVVNGQTSRETVGALMKTIEMIGSKGQP